jgi:hypothetical protein
MALWYRVFGCNEVTPDPAQILEHLRSLGIPISGDFAADESGWYQAQLTLSGGGSLLIERYLANEEGIRGELNSWIAWLETCAAGPQQTALMEHLIQTTQLYNLCDAVDHPDPAALALACVELCRFLARTTAGVYQVDEQGLYDRDGTLLLAE